MVKVTFYHATILIPGWKFSANKIWITTCQNQLHKYKPHAAKRCHIYDDLTYDTCVTLSLKDINECVRGTDDCNTNAACSNTDGSFTCTCNTGFSGDGRTCTGI